MKRGRDSVPLKELCLQEMEAVGENAKLEVFCFAPVCVPHALRKCCICHLLLEDPVQCKDGHLFCRKCIEQWLSNNKTCPVDRATLGLSDLAKNLYVREDLQ